MRKRYLNDSLPNLFKKYRRESEIKVSCATFYRLKPFWIENKRLSSRDTCLCKTHANFDFVVQKLHLLKVVPCNRYDFMELIVCPTPSQACFNRTCKSCPNLDALLNEENHQRTSFYYQWKTEAESRVGAKDKIYDVKITKKSKITCKVSEMIQEMKNQLPVFTKHSFDTKHQYKELDEIRKTLSCNQVAIVIDFSENWYCKYASEIQSMHFGASKKQVSLHTGAFFYKDLQENLQCVSFATVSENLRHDAFAIWAHLDPIFKLVLSLVPGMHTIHFQSDGPSTQYKNRSNLYLFWRKCKSLDLKAASWNFSTPGHGKSSADGTGGTIKAMCDRAVCNGRDITSAKEVVDLVSSQEDGKIRIFEVHAAQIIDVQKPSQKIFHLSQKSSLYFSSSGMAVNPSPCI